MRKISCRGSSGQIKLDDGSGRGGKLHDRYSLIGKKDEGSVLGLTILVLLLFVVATGLLLRASYAEYLKVHSELEAMYEAS